MVVMLLALGGCSADEGRIPPRGEPTAASGGSTRQVVADWDDVEAAVNLAVSQSQSAILEARNDKDKGDRCKWYTLLTIREETGTLEVCREGEGPPLEGKPEALVIKAKLGPTGDSNYEKMLLDFVEQRLKALVGDKVAPIPDPWGINR